LTFLDNPKAAFNIDTSNSRNNLNIVTNILVTFSL